MLESDLNCLHLQLMYLGPENGALTLNHVSFNVVVHNINLN
jgi:hypothetical protein